MIRSMARSILVMHLMKDWNYSHVIEAVLSGPFIDQSWPGGIVTSGYTQAFNSLLEIQKELGG